MSEKYMSKSLKEKIGNEVCDKVECRTNGISVGPSYCYRDPRMVDYEIRNQVWNKVREEVFIQVWDRVTLELWNQVCKEKS